MIIQEIQDRLEKYSNPEKARRRRIHWEKLYQEMPKFYGVSTPVVRKLSFEFFQKVKKKLQLLETWLMKHVHGWGACDDICTHALGAFIYQFPEFIQRTREWTRSENRWVRRASAVVLIYSVRRKEHLGDVFETADALLTDQDIMVQKGYGWMLKEAGNHYPREVFDYVIKNRREMPRTALRYAIEKLSPEHRIEAMKRE